MFDYCFILHWVTELSSRLELKLYRLKTEYLTRVSRYSLRRELSLTSVLNNRNISISTINSPGDSLNSTIRKSNHIFTISISTVSPFLGTKVIACIVILHCILKGVETILGICWFNIGSNRFVCRSRSRIVYNRGWGRLIHNRSRLICYRGRFVDNRSRSVDNWSWPIRGMIVQMV